MSVFQLQQQLLKKCEDFNMKCDIMTHNLSIGVEQNEPHNLCKVELAQKNFVLQFRSVASSTELACSEAITKALKSFEAV